MVKAAQWLMIWAAFTVFMSIVTIFAGIYTGWWRTAVTAAPVVAVWYLFPRLRDRRARQATARKPGGEPTAP
ncbi:hypothetical protein GCM10022403_098980 [Streptomyces coacervatus]|uniref:Integral membrane protein n=1 Tax=Streptomyces coacervatus TaxID=647381 RepID=A0ABP7JRG1_9ACTN